MCPQRTATVGDRLLQSCASFTAKRLRDTRWCIKRAVRGKKRKKNPCYIILHSQPALSTCASVCEFPTLPQMSSYNPVRIGLNLLHGRTIAAIASMRQEYHSHRVVSHAQWFHPISVKGSSNSSSSIMDMILLDDSLVSVQLCESKDALWFWNRNQPYHRLCCSGRWVFLFAPSSLEIPWCNVT